MIDSNLKNMILKSYPSKNNIKEEVKEPVYTEKVSRLKAEGNLSTVTKVMESLGKVITAVMEESVHFGISDNDEMKIPSITWEIVSRELSSKSPLSSIKTNTIKEIIDGTPTGDHFEIFTTFFDCIVEFNVYGKNRAHSVIISEKLEDILDIYKGHLKKIGLSNLFFIKELSSDVSFRNKKYKGTSLIYSFEIQKIKSVRTSSLNSVESIIKIAGKDNQEILLDELSSHNKIL